jgi:hypothetical protein
MITLKDLFTISIRHTIKKNVRKMFARSFVNMAPGANHVNLVQATFRFSPTRYCAPRIDIKNEKYGYLMLSCTGHRSDPRGGIHKTFYNNLEIVFKTGVP